MECHPALQQRALRDACAAAGIAVVAYSPLGAGALLSHVDVVAIARRVKRTPALVLLRWGLQRGLCVIPKVCALAFCCRAVCVTHAAAPACNAVHGPGARGVERGRVGLGAVGRRRGAAGRHRGQAWHAALLLGPHRHRVRPIA